MIIWGSKVSGRPWIRSLFQTLFRMQGAFSLPPLGPGVITFTIYPDSAAFVITPDPMFVLTVSSS